MTRPRFSIATLLKIVGAFGLGLAALRGAASDLSFVSAFWSLATALTLLAMLLGAILGSVYLRGRSRAFAVGFGVFGWSLLLLVFPPSRNYLNLVSNAALLADELIIRFNLPPNRRYFPLELNVEIGNFKQILLLELNLLFALVGAFLARAFAVRREAEERSDRIPRSEA